MAGFFPDWSMAQEIFSQPDYYENILRVYDSFRTDAPDVIVDPRDHMKRIMVRMPEWQNVYRREGELYRKDSVRVSN